MQRTPEKQRLDLTVISFIVALLVSMISGNAQAQSNGSPAVGPSELQAPRASEAPRPSDDQEIYARTIAEGLYDEAEAEMARNDFASACPKLEQVVQLVPTGIGAKLTLAECYEGSGKLASAWMSYTKAARAAIQANQVERQAEAQGLADAVKVRVAELKIIVPESMRALPGLKIQRGGVLIDRSQWGAAVPIDRGIYTVRVMATGKQMEERAINIQSDGVTYSMAFTELRNVEVVGVVSPKPVASGIGDSARRAPEPTPTPEPRPIPRRGEAAVVVAPWQKPDESPSYVQRSVGGILAGAGFVGGMVTAGLGVKAYGGNGEASDYKSAMLVTALVGGGLLTIGITLLATAPSAPKAPAAHVAVGPQGLSLRGTW